MAEETTQPAARPGFVLTRCGCTDEEKAAKPDPWQRHFLRDMHGQPICHKPRGSERVNGS